MVFLPQQTPAADKGIVLSGCYEYNSHLDSQTPKTTQYKFLVALDGCSWIIDYCKMSPTKMDADNLRVIASCDGTNTYIVHLPSGNSEVHAGTYPYCSEVHPEYIWMAFESRCVFDRSEGIAKLPLPVDIGIFSRSDYFCHYRWIMASDGTPDKLVFLHGSSFFSRDHETGEVRKTQLTGPFAGGYMLAVGQWVNKTNINGTLIPTDFLFTGFGPKYNAANSNDLSRKFSFRCVITNIAFTDIPRIPQNLPINAHVTDRRFTQMGYSYVMWFFDVSSG